MSPWYRFAFTVDAVAAIIALAGLLIRGHWRVAVAFGVFLAVHGASFAWLAVSKGESSPEAWTLRQLAHGGAEIAVAFEISLRSFRALPRARSVVMSGFFTIMVATAFATLPLPSEGRVLTETISRLAYGHLATFLWLSGCVLWYNIPLPHIHRAILLLAPYLLLFAAGEAILGSLGWGASRWLSAANTAAFLSLLCYWARACWRLGDPE